jgi:phenylacetic acid degradation operon negative regulatory protein
VSRERKTLTARSVLASTLLGLDPPVLPVGRLVETAALFGITEGTARTALSRMTAAGEVVADDGRYRLSGRLLSRQRRQDEGRHPRLRDWDGRWRMAVVTRSRSGTGDRRTAADRAELRADLGRLRLAEWREGVWVRPDNLHLEPSALTGAHCAWAVADLDEPPLDLWDLDDWAEEARDLLGELHDLPAGTDALAPGFVLSAAVLRHLAADPLLPPTLLPTDWPATQLRDRYDEWDRAYRTLITEWHRSR